MSEVNAVALDQRLLPRTSKLFTYSNTVPYPWQLPLCMKKKNSHVSHTYHSSLHRCRHHSQPGHHIFWNLGRTVLSDTWSDLVNILSKKQCIAKTSTNIWVSIGSGQVLKVEQVTAQLKLPEFAWLSSLCSSPCLSFILGTISQSTWCPCLAKTNYLSKWTPKSGLSLKSLVQSMIPASQRF